MSDNKQPENKVEATAQPASQREKDQELDEATLDKISGGTGKDQFYKGLDMINSAVNKVLTDNMQSQANILKEVNEMANDIIKRVQ